jgi:subtilisin family serine protease
MRIRYSYLTVLALTLAACAEPPVTPNATLTGMRSTASVSGDKTYLVVMSGNAIDKGFSASVSKVGGQVVYSMENIGVALVSSSDPDFAAKASGLKGVQGITPDAHLTFSKPANPQVADDAQPSASAFSGVGSGEPYRGYEWNIDAVRAPGAWAAGAQGAGVRVAIIDGGIYNAHPDLAPNFDAARSRSFVPGQPYNYDVDDDGNGNCLSDADSYFWHATHVAGIVAAAENHSGTIGVAPRATIIGVKALHCGSGDFGAVIAGIYYSSLSIAEGGAGANVINMSLGALVPNNLPGLPLFLAALSRSTSFANQRNVTVLAAAGNEAADLDHTANLVSIPAQSVGVLAVSSTAPHGFHPSASPATGFLDYPASYSNFGQSAISVAAPGGDYIAGNIYDFVLAPCRGGYCFAIGTSMASPAAAGVAALIISSHPGISHTQVESILRKTADDLGKPGQDDFYGAGRVNAARAVQY